MQGRAEFGPRALGNRSILADPRSPGIRDRLNATVKFREEFRPFAPSILDEFGPDYFHDYSPSPYMDRTLRWIAERAPPGVTHVDGTGRLQSVVEAMNPLYTKLIRAFHRRTGVPILLNTSFNVMGRPIIHDVEDALGVFFTSGLELLVIGNKAFAKPVH
jgi:carbamoyltransferase